MLQRLTRKNLIWSRPLGPYADQKRDDLVPTVGIRVDQRRDDLVPTVGSRG